MGPRFDRFSRHRRRGTRAAITTVALVFTLAIAGPALAAAPVPASGAATIDGDPSEWVASDFFSAMKGDVGDETWATLSLRYDCESHVLSAMVKANDGITLRADRPENAYLRIDGVGKLVSGESGNDGTPPDFAWIAQDGAGAEGYEASGIVAPGEHTIRAHVLMADDSADGYLPLNSDPRTGPLTLNCDDVAPTSGTNPSPTGQVEAATGVPVTPPPTDTAATASGSWTLSGLLMVLAGLIVIDLATVKAARVRNR